MILTEDQTAVRDAVRDFAQDRIRPASAGYEAAGGYPPELFRELGGLRMMGMFAPVEVGAAVADYVSCALAPIEVAAADGALSTVVSIQNSIMVTGLIKDGSPAQRGRWLPRLVSGEAIGAFALTEADAGSDAAWPLTPRRSRDRRGGMHRRPPGPHHRCAHPRPIASQA